MKNKIINWLLKKLIIYNTGTNNLDIVYRIVKHLYKVNEPFPSILEKDLEKVLFNAKYHKDMKNKDIPYDLLQTYYKQAGKGDNIFMSTYFYRILRRNKDKEVSKINYKYKRNVN